MLFRVLRIFKRTYPVSLQLSQNILAALQYFACVPPLLERALLVGVPKEIKDHEDRVGLVPATVRELVAHGHRVFVQKDAGRGAGIFNDDYSRAGATLTSDAESIWSSADLIVKVKEPLADERKRLHKGQVLFTYLHLAPDAEQANDLIRSRATCIA
jgi:alanine dehydrogenase